MKVRIVRCAMPEAACLVGDRSRGFDGYGCDKAIFAEWFCLLASPYSRSCNRGSILLRSLRLRRAAIAQLVRALDCGSRGPPFEPGWRYHRTLSTPYPLPVWETSSSSYQGMKTLGAESTRPWLVITIQPVPRLSIDFTLPAPGMISPGATSIVPRALSRRAIPP
jgi:hypothetical protein